MVRVVRESHVVDPDRVVDRPSSRRSDTSSPSERSTSVRDRRVQAERPPSGAARSIDHARDRPAARASSSSGASGGPSSAKGQPCSMVSTAKSEPSRGGCRTARDARFGSSRRITASERGSAIVPAQTDRSARFSEDVRLTFASRKKREHASPIGSERRRHQSTAFGPPGVRWRVADWRSMRCSRRRSIVIGFQVRRRAILRSSSSSIVETRRLDDGEIIPDSRRPERISTTWASNGGHSAARRFFAITASILVLELRGIRRREAGRE